MLLDGSRSQQADVISGVTQGIFLGPLLILAVINDLPESVTTSRYLDDTLNIN